MKITIGGSAAATIEAEPQYLLYSQAGVRHRLGAFPRNTECGRVGFNMASEPQPGRSYRDCRRCFT